jgi:hypothetical protein
MSIPIILEITCGFLFLSNKVFLFFGKRSGWWFNLPGASIGLWLFLSHEPKLWAIAILQMFGIIVSIRGLVAPENRNRAFEQSLLIIAFVLIGCISYLTYKPSVSPIDIVTASAFTIGSVLLGYETPMRTLLGWICYFFGHIGGAYLGFMQHTPYMAYFQIASIFVSIIAVEKTLMLWGVKTK